ncbi:2-hydroxyglutaryl-CoA dehydratase, D-component [Syntrophomonas zehnderi OL-4]|uniref:2-hydroxyglutaryl-CoA dehydratase, D-component n=1 Tax=Syntrophomonas zehnderi OL-4 TaxID=690567 RepID=A0A0E4C8G1_9FIRM|nr:double-cubane-cluster-containing anaerobic reductase [Syntrophomonas zehnderi]CFX42713.1 2-hydroxyglutaryl-CoA dehydratase, D-component [Syntrophomonas zehnderi OL-4]
MSQPKVESFLNIRPDNIVKIKEAKENGTKVVGIYCTYCPEELILAAKAIPVGLCGTKEEPIAAAEETLPRNLCPLIKSSYGFAIEDTCPFFHFSDLVIGETTCDGKKKMFEIMDEIKPVYTMKLPNVQDLDSAFELWVSEMRRLRTHLEEALDVTITDDDIWAAIKTINNERKAAKNVADLNQQDPPPLTGTELLTVTWSRSFAADKVELTNMLNDFAAEVKKRPIIENGVKKPRVLLTGCPVGLGTEKIIKIVEDLGGNVVAMENCTGYKTLELQSDETLSDPIEALARKYIKIPCSCMSPNPYRLQLVERMIHDFKVDAVIDLTWQACHTYNIEAYTIQKLVRKAGVPYLQLETDYSNSDMESLKVRIEAVMEMVE